MNGPESYLGLWQRTLFATGDSMDTRSTVYWLQTSSWHADIRIPADRPDFNGTTSLADCSGEQLSWLAQQQGFAGVTVVTGNQCEWKRVIDFQPPSGKRDIASMHFANPDKLLEYGIEDTYSETWERVAGGKNEHCYALQLLAQGVDAEPGSYLLVSGNHFIHARNRPAGLAQLFKGSGQLQFYPQHLLVQLLDFEISFGLRRGAGDPWQITLSTLPWREGHTLFEKEPVLTQANGTCSDRCSGKTWRVLCGN
ncbi:MAG: Uncharacterized protein AWT59_0981 [Candidatus Gallionella acididurans]|uniref:Uncharacterized protein n=1 Tax=Candidatus Gallionella acididurans TaxID=1796491 RepID=A0A139BV91_9PROT|nr:MAG: Uncharacterized protein AWT59_0981 [Candidatus Gallionella acididurans]